MHVLKSSRVSGKTIWIWKQTSKTSKTGLIFWMLHHRFFVLLQCVLNCLQFRFGKISIIAWQHNCAIQEFILFVRLAFCMSDLRRNFDVLKYEFDKTKSSKFVVIKSAAGSWKNIKKCIWSAMLRQRCKKCPKFWAQTLPMSKTLTSSAITEIKKFMYFKRYL